MFASITLMIIGWEAAKAGLVDKGIYAPANYKDFIASQRGGGNKFF